jgi:hypothetical protein
VEVQRARHETKRLGELHGVKVEGELGTGWTFSVYMRVRPS